MAETTLISKNCPPLPNSETAVDVAPAVPTPLASQIDLWIFRDGKKLVSGGELLHQLQCRISASANNSQSLLDAVIQAGEFEAALADANSPYASTAANLTDELALALCSGNQDMGKALSLVVQIRPPDQLSISPPEGFTYYALHPLDFASVTTRVSDGPGACALIGIRSIGTTLSAVCAAALKKTGRQTSRITVRPAGHPYARTTEFSPPQMDWIRTNLARPAQFLIVDEGPGRSGSTFLSVAEALLRAGVSSELITIIGSREPDPASLCADDAVGRWNAFRFISTTPSENHRFENCTYIGGGDWRHFVNLEPWPDSWTQMERLKFLSPDKRRLFKFEGMGPLGAEVRERAFALAHAGLSPHATDAGDGFLEYEWLKGRALQADALTSSILHHMAKYCAFRVSNFAMPHSAPAELRHMIEFNVRQEFGVEISLPEDTFYSKTPVLVDGRMQPYEWIAQDRGGFFKTDAISHGDDHFFPGPCDIAWDLAGIAIEWQLDPSGCEYLLRTFQQLTGRDLSRELHPHMLAYSVFRLGFCKMAVSTVRGSAEEPRLRAGYERYRRQSEKEIHLLTADWCCTGER